MLFKFSWMSLSGPDLKKLPPSRVFYLSTMYLFHHLSYCKGEKVGSTITSLTCTSVEATGSFSYVVDLTIRCLICQDVPSDSKHFHHQPSSMHLINETLMSYRIKGTLKVNKESPCFISIQTFQDVLAWIENAMIAT